MGNSDKWAKALSISGRLYDELMDILIRGLVARRVDRLTRNIMIFRSVSRAFLMEHSATFML